MAEVDGYIVGALWVRCIQAFGHIDDSVTELAISVYPQFRGKELGTELMKEMLKRLKEKGYTKTSLSVQKDNYALKMYQQVGFDVISENEHDFMMVCNLK